MQLKVLATTATGQFTLNLNVLLRNWVETTNIFQENNIMEFQVEPIKNIQTIKENVNSRNVKCRFHCTMNII